MGWAMRLPAMPATALVNISDNMILDYCKGLAEVMHSVFHQVEEATPLPSQSQCRDLSPKEWVFIKKHVRKSCLEARIIRKAVGSCLKGMYS